MAKGAKVFLILFVVDAVLHLTCIVAGLTVIQAISKTLLMLLLIGVTLSSVKFKDDPSVKFLVLGQFFSCLGDVALISDAQVMFGLGIGMFLVAQLMYLTGYFKLGARAQYAHRKWIMVAYPLFWVVGNAVIAPRLGVIGIGIVIYSAALVTMAMSSMALGTLWGIGGTLFMFSDMTIGTTVAFGKFPGSAFLIMLTYIIGQLIICLCWIRKVEENRRPSAT